MTRWEWVWAVVLAGAVAVFVTVGDPAAGNQRASIQTWAMVALVIGPAMVFCVVGARIWSGTVAAVLLAVVSASSWALFAVFTKAIVDVVDQGPQGLAALLRTPELYGWLLVAVLGTVFQQSSFRASSLTASLPTMTVTEPVVASLLGVTVLGETLGADGPELIALAVAVVVVIVATTALARGEAASMAADDKRRVTTGRIPVSAPEVRSAVAAVAAGQA